jgi:hypothetical protein
LAVQDKAPEIYMPRSGKINGNKDKFLQEDVDFIYNHGKDLINKFGYESMFTGKP